MTVGLLGSVNDNVARGVVTAASPSSRYPALNPMVKGSPVTPTSSSSSALDSSSASADSCAVPSENASRTGANRCATSATRFSAAMNSLTCTSTVVVTAVGHSEANFTNSPSSNRVSVWRPPAEKPRNPASSALPIDSTTSLADPSDLATSASVLAGTMTEVDGTVP